MVLERERPRNAPVSYLNLFPAKGVHLSYGNSLPGLVFYLVKSRDAGILHVWPWQGGSE